jgi:hypothetical protein
MAANRAADVASMAANGVLLWVVASVPRCDKTMTLGADKFARRFLLHVLPERVCFLCQSLSGREPCAVPVAQENAPLATTLEVNKDYKEI